MKVGPSVPGLTPALLYPGKDALNEWLSKDQAEVCLHQ